MEGARKHFKYTVRNRAAPDEDAPTMVIEAREPFLARDLISQLADNGPRGTLFVPQRGQQQEVMLSNTLDLEADVIYEYRPAVLPGPAAASPSGRSGASPSLPFDGIDQSSQFAQDLLYPLLSKTPTPEEVTEMFTKAARKEGFKPLPVGDIFYRSHLQGDSSMAAYLQPLSENGAERLASYILSALDKDPDPGSGLTLACSIDQLMFNIIRLLERWHPLVGLKRKRHKAEASLTLPDKRPDFIGSVRSALLLKSEEKTNEQDLRKAFDELRDKVGNWSQCFHGKVEYMLCWAAAGDQVQFCMLFRDDPSRLEKLGPQLDLTNLIHRIIMLRYSFIILRILQAQLRQLPQELIPLLHEFQGSAGTSITVMDGYITKVVDTQLQPHVENQYSFLIKMYAGIADSQHLITACSGPSKRRHRYRVSLSPYGYTVSPDQIAALPDPLPVARRLAEHILSALRDLHKADAGHTDPRWANVISTEPQLSSAAFKLIDLETAVPLDCKWQVEKHGPHRSCWGAGGVLQGGRFTRLSDAILAGRLLQGLDSVLDGDGRALVSELAEGRLSVVEALQRSWFGNC